MESHAHTPFFTTTTNPHPQARASVQKLFRKNAHVQDPVIVDMLVKKVRVCVCVFGGPGWVRAFG